MFARQLLMPDAPRQRSNRKCFVCVRQGELQLAQRLLHLRFAKGLSPLREKVRQPYFCRSAAHAQRLHSFDPLLERDVPDELSPDRRELKHPVFAKIRTWRKPGCDGERYCCGVWLLVCVFAGG